MSISRVRTGTVWRKGFASGAAKRYERMAELISTNYRYGKVLSDVIDSEDCDRLSRALVEISQLGGNTLHLIRAMVDAEFFYNQSEPTTILRVNSVSSKMMGFFSRLVGSEFLRECIGPLVREVISTADEYEIDPRKLPDDVSPDELVANAANLEAMVQRFVDRITSPEMLAALPRPMRALCGIISDCCTRYKLPEHQDGLVGGYLLLRFFNPATAMPDAYGVLAADDTPSVAQRRKLILITKVVQTLSNGARFGTKEPYMTCMNGVVERNVERMLHYQRELCVDPLARDGERPWSALDVPTAMPPAPAAGGEQGGGGAGGGAVRGSVNIDHFVFLHGLLDHHAKDLLVGLEDESVRHGLGGSELVDQDSEFIKLIEELGPAPNYKSKLNSGARMTMEDKLDAILEHRFHNLLRYDSLTTVPAMEEARFIYKGPPTKAGVPVFYVIVNRIRPEFLTSINKLILHVMKVFGTDLNEKYAVVVDMSWSSVSGASKKTCLQEFTRLLKGFSRKQRKNLSAVYIVHPTRFSRTVLWCIRAFTSQKLKKKIVDIYNWKLLRQHIDTPNILLPEESMNYIAKAYTVTKVNARGKRQKRMIKLTVNTLLNIDPTTRLIKNERLISHIESIRAAEDGITIVIKFEEGAKGEERSGGGAFGFFTSSKNSTPEDMLTRTYICRNEEERDEIVDELFGMFVRPIEAMERQVFAVKKINKYGSKQERVLKLTKDSLMTLAKHKIKTEIQFIGISALHKDAGNANLVLIHYKNEEQPHRYICKPGDADVLIAAIEEARERCTRENDAMEAGMKDGQIDGFVAEETESPDTWSAEQWARALHKDEPALTTMDLADAELTEDTCKALADGLVHNTHVATLMVRNCRADSGCMEVLSDALVEHVSLREVHIEGGRFGAEAAGELISAVEENPRIHTLRMRAADGVDWGDDVESRIVALQLREGGGSEE